MYSEFYQTVHIWCLTIMTQTVKYTPSFPTILTLSYSSLYPALLSQLLPYIRNHPSYFCHIIFQYISSFLTIQFLTMIPYTLLISYILTLIILPYGKHHLSNHLAFFILCKYLPTLSSRLLSYSKHHPILRF